MPPRIPYRIPPFIFFCENTAIRSSEITATISGITSAHFAPPNRLNEASVTPVEESGITSFASCKPRNAINKPMPAGIAFFTAGGIASNTILRSPVTVSKMKTMPSSKTNTSAFA